MAQECPRCGEETKLRTRTFSDQAMSAFLMWDELPREAVGKPMCDECYTELRDILIDRSHELDDVAAETADKESSKKVG